MKYWACYSIDYYNNEPGETSIVGVYSTLNNARIAILNELNIGQEIHECGFTWDWALVEDKPYRFSDGRIYSWSMTFENRDHTAGKDELYYYIEEVELDHGVEP